MWLELKLHLNDNKAYKNDEYNSSKAIPYNLYPSIFQD